MVKKIELSVAASAAICKVKPDFSFLKGGKDGK
jgi:hypothetical protein